MFHIYHRETIVIKLKPIHAKLSSTMSDNDKEYNGFTVKELKEQRDVVHRAYYQKEISRDQYLDQLQVIENEILVSSQLLEI